MKKRKIFESTEAMDNLLRASGSANYAESGVAMAEFAKALELPLRQGIMSGDILNGIFEPIPLTNGASAEFPLDVLAPGTEKDFAAYSIPNHGYIPQRHVEGDYVIVPTYDIGNSIDWNLKYARDARWDIVRKATEVFEAGFVQKLNDDGMQTVLAAGADRNIIVLDSDAGAGQFTKRLVSVGKTVMRRNGGGNSTSSNRGKLTHIIMSPEAEEDIRNWNVDQVDEVTRRQIFVAEGDGALSQIFGVTLIVLDEFGEGQSMELFYENELGGSLPAGDVEIAVGLDLSKSDSFVMPVKSQVQVFDDPTLHRQRRAGVYGWLEGVGFAVLDGRRVILMSM